MPSAPDDSDEDSDEERILNGENFLISAPVMAGKPEQEEKSQQRQEMIDTLKHMSSKITLASEKTSQKRQRSKKHFSAHKQGLHRLRRPSTVVRLSCPN